MKHHLIETGDSDSYRQIEDSNGEVVLAQCRVCNCAEGELPTDCPGFPVAESTRASIYNGAMNFVNGMWVENEY